MIDSFLEAVIDGRVGVAAVAIMAWLLEYRRGRERERQHDKQNREIAKEVSGAIDSVTDAVKGVSTSMALLLDRRDR